MWNQTSNERIINEANDNDGVGDDVVVIVHPRKIDILRLKRPSLAVDREAVAAAVRSLLSVLFYVSA